MPGWFSLDRVLGRAPAAPVDLAAAGRIAIAEAARIFALDVWDPPSSDHRPVAERWRDEITACIAGDQGLGWTWEGRYAGDGAYEWCGAFASRCWAKAGLPLATRKSFWSSCYRLHRWASYLPIDDKTPNPKPKDGTRRLCVSLAGLHEMPAGVTPQAGDVLIVGDGVPAYGDHITLVESFDGHAFHTIEGNGRGMGPDGKPRQGVVKATRMLSGAGYSARWLIRPAPSDLA